MKTRWKNLVAALLSLPLTISSLMAEGEPVRVLVLVEGKTDLRSYAMGDGRHLATLLGHFNATTDVLGVDEYAGGQMRRYDQIFYIGFNAVNMVPETFLADIMSVDMPVVWIHTGFAEFCGSHDVADRFGFSVSGIDSIGGYNKVVSFGNVFTKEEPNINLIRISDRRRVEVLAYAGSSRTSRSIPYIVRSGNLIYVADSPFSSISSADRYLLFADMLHDILHQPHEESHTAIIRIEDVNPMEDPGRLRDIADLLSARGVPFLVAVTPFYVNPGEGVRVSLSDKPEVVDALKYMVRNGGTIVMHGTTHQYKGVTASDYEFWDAQSNRPLKEQSSEAFARKIEIGIREFMKNGLYPLAWETPHYAGSFLLYETVARYFSTAIEQRLAIEDLDYSQFYPYVINRDLFGQRILPENLGYVPLETSSEKSEAHIRSLIQAARTTLNVRDGFASCFFHAFVDLNLLEELVDGIQALGYTYLDIREQDGWVKLNDRIILAGSQAYSLTLRDQYLQESFFDRNGEILRTSTSGERLSGTVERNVVLTAGEFYKAEPAEFRERTPGVFERITRGVQRLYDDIVVGEDSWKEARPVILWNHFARGAAYNDQASFAAMIRSVNIRLDTIFVGQRVDLAPYNLVIVPFSVVDSMTQEEFDAVVRFTEDGGNLLLDTRNHLSDELHLSFGQTTLGVTSVLDRFFPEERIVWRYSEQAARFSLDEVDEVFCVDNPTEAPLAVGKKLGKGRVIFFGTRFDPHSQLGYSHYPFALEYIRRYFRLGPIVRRENLEMYFDPGFRHSHSAEDLVKQWVKYGIRRIHIAGWHQYPTYTYDYERLIRLAHANGLLVYAWLEPPQVSQKFWMEHPEWREKNHKGEDVRPSWRYPVSLSNDSCLAAMVKEFEILLTRHDWDGVNIAELYFEAGRGFEQPALWTPMHPSAQARFKQRYHFGLPALFVENSPRYWKTDIAARNAAIQFRVDELDAVYERLLAAFGSIAAHRSGFQILVTAMDSYGSPELREQIGVDMQRILKLQQRYAFLLQVEDPEHLWSSSPLRYKQMGAAYREKMGGDGQLLLDLNILGFREADEVTPFPTMIPTGAEALQLVHQAALGAPRSTIYAESSVNPQDMMLFSYASAVDIGYTHSGESYILTSPVSFVVKLPPDVREISLNGTHLVPMRDNAFVIPSGSHTLTLSPDPTHELSEHQIQPRIMSFTGNLTSLSYGMRTIRFTYETQERALVSIDREVMGVTVDGGEYPFTSMKGNDCYSVFLPPGHHTVDLLAGDVFTHGVHMASFWSSAGIAVFGLASVTLLLSLYAAWAVLRRRVKHDFE